MSFENDPRHVSLADLAHRCEQETNLYFKRQSHDTRYCYELFRRAIQEGNSDVWDTIYGCYTILVASWVKKHPGFEATGEDVDYFVNGAFGKLSVTLTQEKFDGFSDLESILQYLKMCVFSVIVDYLRWAEHIKFDSLDAASMKESAEPSPEEQVIEHSARQSLWNYINVHLHNEKERWVVRGMFILSLKPQALIEYVPHMFQDVDEVYRVKQNIFARLRRDQEFRKLFGEYD